MTWMTSSTRQVGAAPAAGAAIWAVTMAAIQPAWRATLLMLSPFVLVPLGLRIAASGSPLGRGLLLRIACWSPIPAVIAASSFLVPEGPTAAALCLPWLITSALIAAVGASRLGHRGRLMHPSIGLDVGLLYLVVGAAWLVLWRAGAQPMGFGSDIVGLTAVHFHYAGFALPVAASASAVHLNRGPLVPVAVCFAVPFTALGITVGGDLEWLAATIMAAAGLGAATLLLQLAVRTSKARRVALALAGICLALGMTLALGWAWSMALGWRYLALDVMVRTHGTLNALGFGLLGLAALAGLPVPSKHAEGTAMSVFHLGRPSESSLAKLATSAADEAPTAPSGMLHAPTPAGFRRDRWTRPVEHGDFDAARHAITTWAAQRSAGLTLSPPTPDIAQGVTMAFAYPVGPGAVTGTCRIVEVIDGPDRFGFVYATLPHHPECGEELFLVERTDGSSSESGAADGAEITAVIEAVWRPGNLITRIGLPATRFFQRRATRRYLDGLATALPARV